MEAGAAAARSIAAPGTPTDSCKTPRATAVAATAVAGGLAVAQVVVEMGSAARAVWVRLVVVGTEAAVEAMAAGAEAIATRRTQRPHQSRPAPTLPPLRPLPPPRYVGDGLHPSGSMAHHQQGVR